MMVCIIRRMSWRSIRGSCKRRVTSLGLWILVMMTQTKRQDSYNNKKINMKTIMTIITTNNNNKQTQSKNTKFNSIPIERVIKVITITLEKDTNRTFSNNRNNSNRMIHHIIDTNSLISNLWSWLILINNNSSSNNNKRKMMMMMVDRNKDMFNSK